MASGVETKWGGGLLNTTTQSIKGEKTFRDWAKFQKPIAAEVPKVVIGTELFGGLDGTVRIWGGPSVFTSGSNGQMNLYSIAGQAIIGLNQGIGGTIFSNNQTPGKLDVWTADLYLNTQGRPGGYSISNDVGYGQGQTYTATVLTGATITKNGSGYVTDIDFDTATLEFIGGILTNVSLSTSPPPSPPPPPPGTGAVFGIAWYDVDEDGTKDAGELPASGREFVLTGSATQAATTDSFGYATITGLTPGDYTLTVILNSGETCSANGSTVTVTSGALTNVNIPIVPASPPAPTTSGIVVAIYKDGALASREVSYSGESSGSQAASSLHSINNLPVGDYAITLILDVSDDVTTAWDVDNGIDTGSGLTTDVFTISTSGKTYVRFDMTTNLYTISGTVTRGGSPEVGYTINLTGDATDSDVTDGSGNYSFSVAAGTYNVAPSLTGGDSSVPADYTGIVVTTANVTGRDFVLTALPPPP